MATMHLLLHPNPSNLPSPSPLLHPPSSSFSSPSLRLRCHASNEKTDPSFENKLDRRNLLQYISIAGALPHVLSSQPSSAEPVQYPDYRQCDASIDVGGGTSLNCCLPASSTILDFHLPSTLPLRTRRPAHLATPNYIAQYTKAYQLLRQLPADDPRQYTLQYNVHCALCDSAYTENGTSTEYQVHNSWLFFPWHRWYIYFHERILAKLLNDDSFALPVWTWDIPAGNTLPSFYLNNDSLYDANRNPNHLPPSVIDLNFNFTDSGLSPSDQQASNNTVMYRQIVSNAKTPSLFFGLAYRQGDEASPGQGTVESVPHGPVHIWTGNPSNTNDEDMGALYSAARDPVFFAHHANVDRMWEVWKSLGGRRKDITDQDWLNASFLFYDENANLVRVKISDALDISKLAYTYENVDMPWLTSRPTSLRKASLVTATGPAGTGAPSAAAAVSKEKKVREFKERESKKVKEAFSALVKRPKKVRARDFEEEVLVIEGLEIAKDEKVKFDVFVNLLEAEEKGASCAISEYAGTFYNVPHLGHQHAGGSQMGPRLQKSNFRIAIGEVLKELNAENDDSFNVTIVPRFGSSSMSPFSIQDIRIEYE